VNPRVLFLIASDPRSSPRPAEAVRIAAGIGAWHKADVRLCLRDAAVLALGECVEDLVDDDHFTRYLPILHDNHRPVLVPRGSPHLADLGQAILPWREIDDHELALEISAATYTLRF